MTLAVVPRVFVDIVRRSLARDVRPFREGDPMDVCLQWRSKQWNDSVPVYARRGLLHVTLCGHEGLRALVRRRIARVERERARSRAEAWRKTLAINGIDVWRGKYTRRITIFFFTFCLAIEWCTKVSIEKVDVWDVAKNAAK